ncbi:hypothetical protein NGH92_13030, partial [Staphylococcus succinus]|uniref:sigma factor n=1 Tax=Staphylococcus succinus TaxID=61015 RepID=UPI002DBC2BDD
LCQEVLLKLLRILSDFDFTKSTPFEHYVNRIITTVKNDYLRNDKEDLCQEVLLKLLRILSDFDFTKSTPFEHYVNRIITTVKN